MAKSKSKSKPKSKSTGNPAQIFLFGGLIFLILKAKSGSTGTIPAPPGIHNPPVDVNADPYNSWVQNLLNYLFPSAHLVTDGIIGPATRSVLTQFQQIVGISTSGIIDGETDGWLRFFDAQPYSTWVGVRDLGGTVGMQWY